jgi:hypothetical protein
MAYGNKRTTHSAADRVTSFGMLNDRGAAAFDRAQKCGTEAATLQFVVLRCVVEFVLGERVE